MKCDERAVLEYLDGVLPAARQAEVEDHMAACSACRTRMQSLEQTLQLAGHVKPPTLSPLHANAVAYRVRSAVARRDAQRRMRPAARAWVPALTGATSAVVALVALLFALDWLPPTAQLGPAPVRESAVAASDLQQGAGLSAETLAYMTDEQAWPEDSDAVELTVWIDEYLVDTASDEELFDEAEALVMDDDLYSLVEVY